MIPFPYNERMLKEFERFAKDEMKHTPCREALLENVKNIREEAKEHRHKLWLSKFLGGIMPAEDLTFDSFDRTFNREIFETMRAFKPETENIYLYGNVGVGKTHLSTAVAHEALDAGKKAMVIRVGYFLKTLSNLSPKERDKQVEKLSNLDVLVVDDIESGTPDPDKLEALQEVIDRRIARRRNGLIFTSNFDLNLLAEKYSDRIPSRIISLCRAPHGSVVKVVGKDYRLNGNFNRN